MYESIVISISHTGLLHTRVSDTSKVSYHKSGVFIIDYDPGTVYFTYEAAIALVQCGESDDADVEFFGNSIRWNRDKFRGYLDTPLDRVSVSEATKNALAERFFITRS